MNIIKKYYLQITGLVVGIAGGYLYFHFIGCRSGSCAITSNPYMSMIWGGLMGYLLFDMVAGYLKPKKQTGNDEA
jgi:xanthine/uracil permease